MKWLAKLFPYTRCLEAESRLNKIIVRRQYAEISKLGIEIASWERRTSEFSKMTIAEIEEVLSACVDYQRCLIKLRAADPIQHRVLPIFEKYNIKVERNTATDKVIEEAQEYVERLKEREEEG